MKSRISPNVVVTQTMAIFQLLLLKDKTLLIWRVSFFVLNFCLYHLNDVCRLRFQSDHVSSQCPYKDLHEVIKPSEELNLSKPYSHSDNGYLPIASRQTEDFPDLERFLICLELLLSPP